MVGRQAVEDFCCGQKTNARDGRTLTMKRNDEGRTLQFWRASLDDVFQLCFRRDTGSPTL
eukprot:scaffold3596_cov126-Cylindrotheca_fusiformis.AAC.15